MNKGRNTATTHRLLQVEGEGRGAKLCKRVKKARVKI